MRLLLLCAVAVAAVVMMTGCAGFVNAPVSPGMGFIYSDYKMPLDTNHLDAKTLMSDKKGEATAENVLGLVITGDASVKAAAADGKISEIHYVDYKFWNILGLYSKFTVIVYGE